MSVEPVRYQSADEDSARWLGFPFRDGDIVISTRSKTGTTWLQMICGLLIFQQSELPAPLSRLSPWLDWQVRSRDEVFAQLATQEHRRFIKSHTPLDGIPVDPRVTYVVAGRHPLDAAVSLYHQGGNINRAKVRELLGQPGPEGPLPARPSLHDWLVTWIASDADPREQLDSLPGIMAHLSDAWARRDQPNVVLVHYDELLDDLEGAMRQLADRLGIDVPEPVWPDLVRAATFDSMRATAERMVPDPSGILKDRSAFFRRGTSGGAREVLDAGELGQYDRRVGQLAPAALLEWLHGNHVAAGGRR